MNNNVSKKTDKERYFKFIFDLRMLMFKLKYHLYYRPLMAFINFKHKRYRKLKFKVGDIVEFNLSYATVVYAISGIADHKGEMFYKLKGLAILKSNGKNPYMTEARTYNPMCWHFDRTGKLFNGVIEKNQRIENSHPYKG